MPSALLTVAPMLERDPGRGVGDGAGRAAVGDRRRRGTRAGAGLGLRGPL